MKFEHLLWISLLSLVSGGAAVADEQARDPFFIPRPEFNESPVEHEPTSPNLLRLIGNDFKNLVTTKENLVILGVGLGAAWGASHFDEDVAASGFNSELGGSVALDHVFESGEIAGAGHTQLAIAIATFGVGKLSASNGVAELGRDLLRAQTVAGSVTFVMKVAVGRERPDGSSNRSFPSGHTSASFATASVLERRYGWRVGVPAYVFAGYVAGSRLNEPPLPERRDLRCRHRHRERSYRHPRCGAAAICHRSHVGPGRSRRRSVHVARLEQ